MVQTTPDIASSSVPDLRARQPLFKALIVIGLGAIVAAAVAAILFIRTGDNPGRAACEHIDELAQQENRGEYWDKFVNALVRTVEHRAWNSAEHKYVRIAPGSRSERCIESFEVIRDTISYSKYQTLSDCVSKATSWRTGSSCFDNF